MIEAFHIYLTSTRVRVRRQGGLPWNRPVTALPESAWSADVPASLALSLPERRSTLRPSLHVHVGSALCKFMAIDMPAHARDADERLAIAQAHMQHQLGLAREEWTFSMEASWSGTRPVACAMRRTLISRVEQLSAHHGLSLRSLRPFVGGVWNGFDARQEGREVDRCALLAIEDDAFTVMVAEGGALVSVSTMSHGSEADLVAREIGRLGIAHGANVEARVALAVSDAAWRTSAGGFARPATADGPAVPLCADFRDLLPFLNGGE